MPESKSKAHIIIIYISLIEIFIRLGLEIMQVLIYHYDRGLSNVKTGAYPVFSNCHPEAKPKDLNT